MAGESGMARGRTGVCMPWRHRMKSRSKTARAERPTRVRRRAPRPMFPPIWQFWRSGIETTTPKPYGTVSLPLRGRSAQII